MEEGEPADAKHYEKELGDAERLMTKAVKARMDDILNRIHTLDRVSDLAKLCHSPHQRIGVRGPDIKYTVKY